MRWDIRTQGPPPPWLRGATIRLDGEVVRRVRAFDAEAGKLTKLCTGDRPGCEGETRIHRDRDEPGQACEIELRGLVEVEPPEPSA